MLLGQDLCHLIKAPNLPALPLCPMQPHWSESPPGGDALPTEQRTTEPRLWVWWDKPRLWPCNIMEWIGLEGTSELILFQAPCHEQGYLPLDQDAERPVQPGLLSPSEF